MAWVFYAALAMVGLFAFGYSKRRARTFVHEGHTYQRRPGGSFVDSTGAVVTGAVLTGALAASYEAHRRRLDGSGGDAGDSGSWWSSDGDSGGGSGSD